MLSQTAGIRNRVCKSFWIYCIRIHAKLERELNGKNAMAQLRALSEEDKEVVGFTVVKDIVEELEGFLEVDEKDAERCSLMQTIDTNVVVMNGKEIASPCTRYLQDLDYYVRKEDGYITGSLVFALNPRDGLTNKMKTDYKKKACDALKKTSTD